MQTCGDWMPTTWALHQLQHRHRLLHQHLPPNQPLHNRPNYRVGQPDWLPKLPRLNQLKATMPGAPAHKQTLPAPGTLRRLKRHRHRRNQELQTPLRYRLLSLTRPRNSFRIWLVQPLARHQLSLPLQVIPISRHHRRSRLFLTNRIPGSST
jgi:hypothetical protein